MMDPDDSQLARSIRRQTADGVLDVVKTNGAITIPTLTKLLSLLAERTDYPHHVEVAVVVGGLLKTIDNEVDAVETVRRLETKR